MIAVCLLTCGREELTWRTVKSFLKYNVLGGGRTDLALLHADAGGPSPFEFGANNDLRYMFETISCPRDRVPQMTSFRELIGEAAVRGAEFVLWLENDWESVAPIPTLEFLRTTAKEGIITWRLFGVRKGRGDGPRAWAGQHRIGTNEKIDWQPSKFSGWEFGLAHWGAGGTIATLAYLESQLHRPRLKDVITARVELPSARPTENIMWHIGEETTPGFVG